MFNDELQISTTDDIYFFFFGNPAFIFLYAAALTVDFDFGLDVPAFFLAFIFAYNPFLAIVSPMKKKGGIIPPNIY